MRAKKVTLDEIRAYVLLRQSALSPEEKKRVIVDGKGDLQYERVREAIRLLGSRFFQELQGGVKGRTKMYDTNTLMEEAETHLVVPGGQQGDEWSYGDDESSFIQMMAEQNDEDAVFIQEFEEQIIETVQESGELAQCFSAYQDARARLRDRARGRGFWPVEEVEKASPLVRKEARGKESRHSPWPRRLPHRLAAIADKLDTGSGSARCSRTERPRPTLPTRPRIMCPSLPTTWRWGRQPPLP